MKKLIDWVKVTRPQFLSLSAVLVFTGTSVAVSECEILPARALLALFGLVLLHISVNVLNDYSDYISRIDFNTTRTPFSGGSGMLTAGSIAPGEAYCLGIACIIANIALGVIFIGMTNIMLMPILMVGGFCVYFYTDFLARRTLGEISAGLGLGFLPILGSYFVQTGHYSYSAFAVAVPAGILTFNLLLLNEFPDLKADIPGGRKNLLITFSPDTAGKIYSLLMVGMYLWIALAVWGGLIPKWGLIALITAFIAYKPVIWAWSETRSEAGMVPALQANVITNLSTLTLLGIGFLAPTHWG